MKKKLTMTIGAIGLLFIFTAMCHAGPLEDFISMLDQEGVLHENMLERDSNDPATKGYNIAWIYSLFIRMNSLTRVDLYSMNRMHYAQFRSMVQSYGWTVGSIWYYTPSNVPAMDLVTLMTHGVPFNLLVYYRSGYTAEIVLINGVLP